MEIYVINWISCIEFYIQRDLKEGEVLITSFDNTVDLVWSIENIEKPSIEKLYEIWESNKTDFVKNSILQDLRIEYSNLVKEIENDIQKYRNREEIRKQYDDLLFLEMKNKDLVDFNLAILKYKEVTEKYKKLKKEIEENTFENIDGKVFSILES